MATSLLQPSISTSLSSPQAPFFPSRPTTTHLGRSGFLGRTSLSRGSSLLSVLPVPSRHRGPRKESLSCEAFSSGNLNHIPKQFREENLKDGLAENFKNVPSSLYGLSPSQMEMFMTSDNIFARQSQNVKEESISSSTSYLRECGMNQNDVRNGTTKISMRQNLYTGGRGGYGRRSSAPPDLPSLLLDGRIVYLGMPIVPSVAELIIAEFMWLNYDDPAKPVYLYINSPGVQDDFGNVIGSDTDAYSIAYCINKCRCRVYTVNIGMAYGQAAMLLSLGTKGYRFLQPNACTKMYAPESIDSSGVVADVWIRSRDFEASNEAYVKLLARGIGKPLEEMREDCKLPKFFLPEAAIEYGIADKIIPRSGKKYERKNYDQIMAESKAMRQKRTGGGGPQDSASGFR